MEKLVSNGLSKGGVVPETYVFPENDRSVTVNTCESIPVIDLEGGSEDEVSKEILRAGKEFGFFQVINHGVPQELIDGMLEAGQEFFEMPAEHKASYYSEDPRKDPRLFTGEGYGKEGPRYWRDCFIMSAYPLEKFQHLFPEKPTNFREATSKIAPEAKVLATRILKLISTGLGLEEDYLSGDRSGGSLKMVFNYYPSCPDPSLALGIPKHCDRNLITLLIQGKISGLQALHDGQWVSVDPLPTALVVNFGLAIEVVTNGILKAVEHRAVTNNVVPRVSVALSVRPADDCNICPAEALLSKENPAIYGSFPFPEFFRMITTRKTDEKDIMMEDFKIKN